MTAADHPTVAHVVMPYLFATGSWVYGQLVRLRRYRPIVLTDRTENFDVFPFDRVYAYEGVSAARKAILCLSKWRVSGGLEPYFEQVLSRQRARLMHVHFGNAGWEMLETKRATGLPMVTAFYGADVSQIPRDPIWRLRYKDLFEDGELFLAEGGAMRRALLDLGCPFDKVVVQRLGVDVDALPFVARRPNATGTVKVLIAATFREKKGIPDALRAVERVRHRFPKLEVTLIGDATSKPGDHDEKRRILEILGRLQGTVTWETFIPYPLFRGVLLEHHVFLSPSVTARDGDSEGGAPVSIIEAQATGMPIVSTFHADIPEVVVPGESALLSAERDVDGLAENLAQLVAEPGKWEAMGKAGRAHVEAQHNVRVQVARLEQLYSQVTMDGSP
jgi:colanic acid/amylovoran biosynthesis glycosyltransferase